MNPPDDLLGFLRRVKPTDEDREEASMSKEQKAKDQKALEDENKVLRKEKADLEEENARLSDDHEKAAAIKAFGDTLPPAMREAFMAMTPEEQEAFEAQFKAGSEGGAEAPMVKMAKGFETIAKKNEELEKNLQKMRDEQDLTAAVAQFQDLRTVVKVDEFAADYLKLKKASPEAADSMVEKIRALTKQQEGGQLFSIKGGDGDGKGETARQKIKKMVDKIVEADPKVLRHKAQNLVLKNNPDLYEQYKSERTA